MGLSHTASPAGKNGGSGGYSKTPPLCENLEIMESPPFPPLPPSLQVRERILRIAIAAIIHAFMLQRHVAQAIALRILVRLKASSFHTLPNQKNRCQFGYELPLNKKSIQERTEFVLVGFKAQFRLSHLLDLSNQTQV